MTIEQAILKLTAIMHTHGPLVEVYFDCPKCYSSFTPSILVTRPTAIHIKSDK